MKIGKKALK